MINGVCMNQSNPPTVVPSNNTNNNSIPTPTPVVPSNLSTPNSNFSGNTTANFTT
jgi:hypothetical protein